MPPNDRWDFKTCTYGWNKRVHPHCCKTPPRCNLKCTNKQLSVAVCITTAHTHRSCNHKQGLVQNNECDWIMSRKSFWQHIEHEHFTAWHETLYTDYTDTVRCSMNLYIILMLYINYRAFCFSKADYIWNELGKLMISRLKSYITIYFLCLQVICL